MNTMVMDDAAMSSGNSTKDACKVTMFWNWNIIDTCFFKESWHIRSGAGFATLCIGVVMAVICLEFLRLSIRRYDYRVIRELSAQSELLAHVDAAPSPVAASPNTEEAPATTGPKETPTLTQTHHHAVEPVARRFRPSLVQQAIRALLHTMQFALAYWLMMMAMYYNGYILISVVIGAFMGAFFFQWDRFHYIGGILSSDSKQSPCGC